MSVKRTDAVRDIRFNVAVRSLNKAFREDSPATLTPREALTVLAVLGEAAEALRAVGKAAIVVKPTLDEPYADAPDQTPWSRFMCTPARRAYNLGAAIRKTLVRERGNAATQDGDTDA